MAGNVKGDSIKKNVVLSTLFQLLNIAIPFLTGPYIARVLGISNIGIYSFTASNMTYFVMLAGLGTAGYGRREIARARNNQEKYSRLFWEIELLSVITSLFSMLCYIVFICLVTRYKIFYVVLIMGIINQMFDISWLYSGLELFKYTIRQNIMFKLLSVACVFLFVKKPDDILLYVIIMTAGTMLGTMSMWLYLPKVLTKAKINKSHLIHHFRETLVYFIPSLAVTLYTVLDKTLIGIITQSTVQNGAYEEATKVMNITKTITFNSLNAVIGSRVAYLFVDNKFDEIKERIMDTFDLMFLVGCGCSFGVFAIADMFIPVYLGSGYEDVVYLLKLLSPVTIIIGVSNTLGSLYYNPAGLRKKSAMYIVIGSVVNLIINLIMIPKLGNVGAVIGTLCAETVISALFFINCDSFMTLKKLFKVLWKRLVAGTVMAIVVLLLNGKLPYTFVGLGINICCGAMVYFIVLLLLKDYGIKELLLKKVLKLRKG